MYIRMTDARNEDYFRWRERILFGNKEFESEKMIRIRSIRRTEDWRREEADDSNAIVNRMNLCVRTATRVWLLSTDCMHATDTDSLRLVGTVQSLV